MDAETTLGMLLVCAAAGYLFPRAALASAQNRLGEVTMREWLQPLAFPYFAQARLLLIAVGTVGPALLGRAFGSGEFDWPMTLVPVISFICLGYLDRRTIRQSHLRVE